MIKAVKRFIVTFVIFVSSFQLAFAGTIRQLSRVPASAEVSEAVVEKVELFGDVVSGVDVRQKCFNWKQEQQQKDQNPFGPSVEVVSLKNDNPEHVSKWTSRLSKNSCQEHDVRQRQEQSSSEECPYKDEAKPGMIDRLAKQAAMAAKEEDKEELGRVFNSFQVALKKISIRAKRLKKRVEAQLYRRHVDSQQRIDLLVKYLENVLLPMRDMVVMQRGHNNQKLDHYFQNLLISFPSDLIPEENQSVVEKIENGTDARFNPLYLEVVKGEGANSHIAFSDGDILKRDIMALMQAPTVSNYLDALRLMTLQMMLSQTALYNMVLDEDKDGGEFKANIPQSCQERLPGDVPSSLSFMIESKEKSSYVDSMLYNHNLLFSEDNFPVMDEFYSQNNNKDMMNVGYRGQMPFEQYHHAKASLENRRKMFKASLDDVSHFDEILQMKLPEVKEVYKVERRTGRAAARDRSEKGSRPQLSDDWEIFEKILMQPGQRTMYELPTSTGGTTEQSAQERNLSEFLVELMQDREVSEVKDLLSSELREKLESETVKIEMPSLYGSSAWRSWGIRQLTDVVQRDLELGLSNSAVKKGLEHGCRVHSHYQRNSALRDICDSSDGKEIGEKLIPLFNSFSQKRALLPGRRIDTDKMKSVYPFLTFLWRYFRDYTKSFPEAEPSEYELLIGQMKAQNPWARVRLGYLIATEELKKAKEGHRPVLRQTRRGSRMTNGSRCQRRNLDMQLEKVQQAGHRLGLDKPFHIGYANHILSDDEKERFWQKTLEEINSKNSHLFQEKISRDKEAYEFLEQTSYETLLTRGETEDYVSSLPMNLFSQDRESLDQFYQTDMAKRGAVLKEIYDAQGDYEKQEELFNEFIRNHHIMGGFKTKKNFFAIDANMKAPIYRSFLRRAALSRKLKLQDQIDELCGYSKDDHESIQTLFYMTTKSQNKINRMAGLPQVPQHVLDKVQAMSQEEKQDIWLGLGSAGLAIGAIVIGSMCTGLSGGMCAPLSIAMIGASLKATEMQMRLFNREVNRKFTSMENESKIEQMESLGFANLGSSDNVSRTWLWATVEGISIIPLMGIISRSFTAGGRVLMQGGKSLAQRTGYRAFKEATKGTMHEAEVKLAKNVLGFSGLERHMGRSLMTSKGLSRALTKGGVPTKEVQETLSKFENFKAMFKNGKITASHYAQKLGKLLNPYKSLYLPAKKSVAEELGDVAVRQSKGKIDRRTAKVIARYYKNDPHHFRRLLKSYGGKRLEKAKAKMQKFADAGKKPSFFARLRYQELARNAHKLESLQNQMALVTKHGDDLENFIYRNMDDLTEVFLKIPMRKREIPYMVVWMGAPFVRGKRVAGMAEMADGLIMRKFFNARARLVYESFKSQARETLQLPQYVSAETTAQAIQAFKASVNESIETLGKSKSRQLASKLADWDEMIMEHMKKVLRKTPRHKLNLPNGNNLKDLGDEGVARLLFAPSGPREKVLSERLWSSLPQDVLVNSKSLEKSAHTFVEELSNYKNVDQFERFLNALKVLAIKKDPGVVEFF